MAWDGNGNFTRTDGTRTGSQVWTEADAAAVGIESDDHDVHDQDLADGIEACLAKNGENTATLIVMGGELKMEGNQLVFDADEDTHFAAGSDDIIIGTVGGVSVFQLSNAGSALATLQVRSNDAGAAVAPSIVTFRDSASPADDDLLGEFRFDGEDSGGAQTTYAAWRGRALDVTDATEDGAIEAYCMTAGTLTRMLRLFETTAQLISEDAGAGEGPSLVLHRDSASPADSDLLGEVRFDGEDDGGAQTVYAAIRGRALDVTNATEDGAIDIYQMLAGSLTRTAQFGASSAGVPQLSVFSADAGADSGPFLSLSRQSASAADDDGLGTIFFIGHNDNVSPEDVSYGSIAAKIIDNADGAEYGQIAIRAMINGTLTTVADFGRPVGEAVVQMVGDGRPVADFNRASDDGTIIQLSQASTVEGTISVSGTTVSYNAFTGGHDAQWGGEAPEEDPPLGTLLSSTGEEFERERPKPQLWKVKIADRESDRAVMGVYGGRLSSGSINVHAIGTIMARVVGPVGVGDLLEASEIPGVARRQNSDAVLASTLGKVTRGNSDPGEKLVACVAYSG